MHAATIIARNYLPLARVLAESFREHHPGLRFTTLIIDDLEAEVDERDEPFELLRLGDVGLDPVELGRMTMIYDVMELATAMKPWLLRSLLDSGGDAPVMYLDADIEVFAPLDDLGALANAHGIVLTPHGLQPMQRDGRRPTEGDILRAGVYNLGFIAVGASARPFLDWWSERLLRDGISDPERMLFTDQRWIDFVPGYFEHHIVRDPGCNVAYWNVDRRELTRTGQAFLVDGVPLRFFHFSGYSPDRPHLLSKHQGEQPRVLLSEQPALAALCAAYGERLRRAGHTPTQPAYGHDQIADDVRIDRRMRRLYRAALVEYEREGGPPPPDPRAEDGAAFLRWLNEPVVPISRPLVSRYLMRLYEERPDLQAAFPDLGGPGGVAFLEWARGHGRTEVGIPDALLPPSSDGPLPTRTGDTTPGFNVAGYFRAELGVGEAARLLLAAIESAALPHSTMTYAKTTSRQSHSFDERAVLGLDHNVNIVCVNADQTEAFAGAVGPGFFAGRATVGVWYWEVTEFPASLSPAFAHVDEIWVASHHTWKAIAPVSPKPVYVLPPPILSPPVDPTVTRGELGLPDAFLFLFAFDFLSVHERKNPIGLIDAFSRAFRPGEGPVLVLKTINGDKKLNDLEQVRAAAAERPDVIVLDQYLSATQKNALIDLCDCYVSLHRSEGFGLTMAEAMSLGKPVIATAYSGNLEFMDHRNSYLVPYSTVPVGAGCDPYPPKSRWAAPDLDAAAALMRGVHRDPAAAAQVGRRAQRDVRERHSPAARAGFLRERLADLQGMRRASQTAAPGGEIRRRMRHGLVAREMEHRRQEKRRTAAIVKTAAELEDRLRAELETYRRRPPGGGDQGD